MEFLIQDPDIHRLPPEDVRIEAIGVEPYPEGRRVRVALELTPFQQRPDIELTLKTEAGEVVGSASIIEPISWRLELTLHLRQAGPFSGRLTLAVRVLYPDMEAVDQRTLPFEMLGEQSGPL